MSDSKARAAASKKIDQALIDERDYRALETVLTQTERGRAFLCEYLTRNGAGNAPVDEQKLPASSDTARILSAISDLHEAIREQQSQPSVAHVRMDILEMARAIRRTRAEIAALRTQGNYDQLTAASEEMDAIVNSTEKATTDILQSAERIQEVAWQLRESGAEDDLCEVIDNCATDIYTACSFQDLTGQRTTKVVRVLQYLEARITSMVEIWGLAVGSDQEEKHEGEEGAEHLAIPSDARPDAHLLNGPQLEGDGLGQDNVDELMGGFASISAELNEQAGDDEEAADDAFLAAAVPREEKKAADVVFAGAGDESEEIDEQQLKALFG